MKRIYTLRRLVNPRYERQLAIDLAHGDLMRAARLRELPLFDVAAMGVVAVRLAGEKQDGKDEMAIADDRGRDGRRGTGFGASNVSRLSLQRGPARIARGD